jgi:hypothetical protein
MEPLNSGQPRRTASYTTVSSGRRLRYPPSPPATLRFYLPALTYGGGQAPVDPGGSSLLVVLRRCPSCCLRRASLRAWAVQLTVKYDDFTSLTRRRTLEVPTDDGQTLYREARALLSKVDLSRAMRLTGVSAQELEGQREQLPLFGDPTPTRAAQLNAAIDRITTKFGGRAITTADLPLSDGDAVRDGFYSEEKRAHAQKAEQRRLASGLRVERDEEPPPDDDGA